MAKQTLERVSRSWTTRRDEKRGRMQVIANPDRKEGLKNMKIQFLTGANLTPRNVARFSHVGSPGAPLSRDAAPRLRSGRRATITFGG